MSATAFSPNATVTLSVTSTTGNVAYGSVGDFALIQNTGAKTVYLKSGLGSGTRAATTDTPLQAGAAIKLDQQTDTYLAAICGGSDTSTLSITSGSGDPDLSLSAEVSISGLVVTAVSEAQANAAAQSWTEGTNNPLSQNLTGDLRTIAKQSGTWTAATNADAAIAPGTAPAKALVAGAVYNSSAPAPTTGQTLALQLDASGNLKVNIAADSSTVPSGTYTDKTITSMSGSSQTLIASNASRKSIVIQNTGNANIGVSISGGTAVIGGAATLTLAPGASYTTSGDFVPTNAITVIGTAAQPVAAFEG